MPPFRWLAPAVCLVLYPACGPQLAVDSPAVADVTDESGAEQALSLNAPAVSHDFADPFVLRVGETYHGYSTNSVFGNVPHRASSDLVAWGGANDAFPHLPSWAAPGNTWAPSVARIAGKYLLYFTARHRASGRQCIGVASASKPEGPFVAVGSSPLVCQLSRGGSIDASPFIDTDGRAYLLWKNDGNCCGLGVSLWSQRLSSTGRSLSGVATRLLNYDRAWENPLIEGPSMLRENGHLLLFYSANWWESSRYAVGYAACSSPLGPCTKKTLNGPWFSSFGDFAGPGGQEFFRDEQNHPWMSFHAWTPGNTSYRTGGARAMYVLPVGVDGEGRPFLVRRPEARGIAFVPSGAGAVVLNSWGELQTYGFTAPAVASVYWRDWDIARGIAMNPNGRGGYVLDGWGGVHTFTMQGSPPPEDAHPVAYWKGWDIARAIVVLPTGTGGYVLDGWGRLHAFPIGSGPKPPACRVSADWPGQDLSRGVVLLPAGNAGYVLDGHGGIHGFSCGGVAMPPAVRGGKSFGTSDFMRGIALAPDGTRGYVVDLWGSLYPFAVGSNAIPPAPKGNTVWAWSDAARGVAVRADGTTGATVNLQGGWSLFSAPAH